MRIFSSEKRILIINKKKAFAVFLMFITLIVLFMIYRSICFYSLELQKMMRIKSNNMFQKVVNDAVIEVCNNDKFMFTEITYSDGIVSAINYNTNDINKFKAEIVKIIIDNINTKKLTFKIFLTDGFNNVFLLNKGPSFNVECTPYSGIKVECFSKFEDAGVNQTKNTIWFEIAADIYASGSVLNTTNSFKYTVAVGETIIVGNIPESYTNVTDDENVQEKVLNLQ